MGLFDWLKKAWSGGSGEYAAEREGLTRAASKIDFGLDEPSQPAVPEGNARVPLPRSAQLWDPVRFPALIHEFQENPDRDYPSSDKFYNALDSGKLDLAFQLAHAAYLKDPSGSFPWFRTAHEHQKTLPSFEAYLRKELAAKPDCWYAFAEMGSILGESYRPQEAIEYYSQALRCTDVSVDAVYGGIGLLCRLMDDGEETLSLLLAAKLPEDTPEKQEAYRTFIETLKAEGGDPEARYTAILMKEFGPIAHPPGIRCGKPLFTSISMDQYSLFFQVNCSQDWNDIRDFYIKNMGPDWYKAIDEKDTIHFQKGDFSFSINTPYRPDPGDTELVAALEGLDVEDYCMNIEFNPIFGIAFRKNT